MSNIKKLFFFLLGAGLFVWAGTAYAVGAFPIGVGGTGTTTAPTYGKVYIGDANGNLEYTATSSLGISSGGSGTVTSIATTFPITGGTITTTGTIGFSGLSTTSPWTSPGVAYVVNGNTLSSTATSTPSVTSPITYSGTLGSFVGGSAGTFACSTCLTANQSITLSGVVSGSGTTAITTTFGNAIANSILANNSGVSATPSFIATSTLGIAISDTTGTLAVARGGTGAVTKTNAFDALSPMTTTGDLIVGGLSGTGIRLAIGTAGTILSSSGGTAAWVATSSVAVSAGLTNTGTLGGLVGGTAVTLKQVENRSFTYATTTAWTGTTTIALGIGYGEVWNTIKCFTDTGTLNVDFYHATTHFSPVFNASTTIGIITTSGTDTIGDKVKVDIGTPASTPTTISCTVNDTI